MMENAGYIRTVSSDDGDGFNYEKKMTALAALRLYQQADEFYLANNFAKGGKFDDVVFTATINGQDVTWFVQLKHKQVSTLNERRIGISALRTKDEFNLTKYFQSHLFIDEKFRRGSNDPIFGKPVNSVKFVLFTNSRFHPLILNPTPPRSVPNLLTTNSPYELNVMFTKEELKEIFQNTQCFYDGSLERFCSKFIFCTGQANESDLDELIQREIELIKKDLSKVEVKYVTHQLYDAILKWVKTGQFLKKEDIGNILSRTSIETQYGRRNECSLEFVPTFITFVQNSYKSHNLIALKSKAHNTTMCMTFCKQAGLTDDPNKLLSLQQVDKPDIQELLLNDWQTKAGITLVIDCEGDIMGVDKPKLVAFIEKLAKSRKENVILMIVTMDNEEVLRIANLAKAKEFRFNCTLSNLSAASVRLLCEREVDFQGYKTKLSTLMPNGKVLNDVFNMELMTLLLQGRALNIGVKPLDNIPYYVTRVLIRQASTDYTLFTEQSSRAYFALSGITLEQAIMNFPFSLLAVSASRVFENSQEISCGKIIILEENHAEEFEKLSKIVKGDLHWFELKKGGKKLWQWKKSKDGSKMSLINDHVRDDLDYVPTDNIMDMVDKVVVITAEPGMGKSTLLEHLAAETKRLCPYVWVICLALNDFTEHFDRKDFISKIAVSTKNLIAAAAGVDKETSKFDARLFNQCYDVTGNMIVLLDGFDEITPYYTKQGLMLIDELKKTKVSRVWVTARPHWRDMLEERTSTLSYNIKAFTAKDQQNFLFKYWKHELPNINDVKLKEFVMRVLFLIEKCFDKTLHQFTGIPLQTRMIGEVFLESVHSYHDTDILSLKDRLNGLELFQEFVNKKRGIQMEKAKVTVSNASAKWEQRRLNEQREKELMSLALLTLLQRKVCQQLTPPVTEIEAEGLKLMVKEGNEKSGIVLSFKGDQPQFIHRTFAEYFAALFFTKHFATNKNFLTGGTFFEENFQFVKYFFDRILCAEKKFHEAVLDSDVEVITELLKSGDDINSKDRGGRTPLHLAAALPESDHVIRVLLQNGADAKLEDEVLGWRPIQYACKIRAVENIAPLLEKCPGPLEEGIIPITWQSLQRAVQGDYLQLLLYLLENGIYEVESLDDLSPQMWLDEEVSENLTILHIAAAYNASEILSYLLKKKTRDSKARLIECVDSKGNTPLLLAGARGCGQAIRVLVHSGANSLAKSRDGRNLIQFAVERQDLDVLTIAVKDARERKASAEDFLPATLNALISERGERLEWATRALQLLFNLYPEASALKTPKGVPLLQAAIQKGNAFAVERLCELGADVNLITPNGPLLHYATRIGDEEVMKILIGCKNLDINVLDADGHTVLDKAVMDDQTELINMLMSAGATFGNVSTSILHTAIVEGQESMVQALLSSKNIDVNQLDAEGHTPLFRAILTNNSDIIELLIDAGATIGGDEVNTITARGPLLHVAVVNGQEDMVMALIASPKLQINLADDDGYTALYKSAFSGKPDIFQTLVNAGADMQCIARNGRDLTHAVASSQNEAVFFYLLEMNFNFRKPDCDGRTALDMLIDVGAWNLVKIVNPDAEITSVARSVRVSPEAEAPAAAPPAKKKKNKNKNKTNGNAEDPQAGSSQIPPAKVVIQPQPSAPPKKKQPQPNLPKKKAKAPVAAVQTAPKLFDTNALIESLKALGITSTEIHLKALQELSAQQAAQPTKAGGGPSQNPVGGKAARKRRKSAQQSVQNLPKNNQPTATAKKEQSPPLGNGVGQPGGGPHLKINPPKPENQPKSAKKTAGPQPGQPKTPQPNQQPNQQQGKPKTPAQPKNPQPNQPKNPQPNQPAQRKNPQPNPPAQPNQTQKQKKTSVGENDKPGNAQNKPKPKAKKNPQVDSTAA